MNTVKDFLFFFLFLFLAIFFTSDVKAVGYPHYLQNGLSCSSCHDVYNSEPKLMPPWTSEQAVQNIDDQQFNKLCWSCHNELEGGAPYVVTHSSLQADDSYGHWTVECRVCHEPHFQMQAKTYTSDYVEEGVSSGITATTLTEGGAGWSEDEFAGMILIPNRLYIDFSYKIIGNTADTITVDPGVPDGGAETMNLSLAHTGDSFVVSYGKLIRSTIDRSRILEYENGSESWDPGDPNISTRSGTPSVKLIRPEGDNSFADSDSTFDGVCQICHTKTNHFRNTGEVNVTATGYDHTSVVGTYCIRCHSHENGFMHGSGSEGCVQCHGHDAGSEYDPDMSYPPVLESGTSSLGAGSSWSHSTHTEYDADDKIGPQIYCDTCHDTSSMPLFKNQDGSGGHSLEETDICDNCHSPGGTYNGVTTVADSVGAKTNWHTGVYEEGRILQSGKEKWCAGCHDEEPSNSWWDGSGVDAPNVIGDEDGDYIYGTGWGFYKTGHGLASQEPYPYKGGFIEPSLVNGAARPVECNSCHDLSLSHIDQTSRTFDCSDGCDSSEYWQSYRLALVDGEDPMQVPWPFNSTNNNGPEKYRLCVKCHDSGPFTDAGNMNTNMITGGTNRHEYHLGSGMHIEEYPADYNFGSVNSQINCVACHNVHGSTKLAMIRDGKLINREPGLEIWYTKTGITQTFTFADPEPKDLPLALSDGQYWRGYTAENLCNHCHGGNYLTTRDPFQDVDQAPLLDWTGETGYVSDGASPDSGSPGSSFTFRVKYTDYNNDSPSVIQLWIDLNDDGDYDDTGEKIGMVESDASDDWTYDGKLYKTLLTVGSAGDDVISYRFYASDGTSDATGSPVAGSSIQLLPSTANNAPELEWVAGDCRYQGVSPAVGISGTVFEFYVKYTDADDEFGSMQLWIDLNDDDDFDDIGEKLDMGLDGGDGDYTNGENFTKSLILNYAGDGKVKYRFVASDGTTIAVGDPAYSNLVSVIDDSSGTIRTVCAGGSCDSTTIQPAVDASAGGDTVLVYDGTYNEKVSFYSDDNNIYVRSVCGPELTIIDASGVGNGVYHNMSNGSVVDGFQIINGSPGVNMTKWGNLTIDNCIIHDNPGSGISVNFDGTGVNDAVYVRNSLIYGNQGTNGAGLYLRKGGGHILTNTIVRDNIATGNGGGICQNDAANLTVTNSIIADNQAATGGGFWIYGQLTVTNSTIANNTASGTGGGFRMRDGSGGPVTIRNSILWGNKTDPIGGGHIGYLNSGTTFTVEDSIVSNGGGIEFDKYPYFAWNGNTWGTLTFSGFISGADPQFVDAENSDYHIQNNSPAVDNANAVAAPDDDIDNDSRPQGDADDIGADELSGTGEEHPPTLGWTEESGFSGDGVQPDNASCGSSFEFRVTYTDADNEPPAIIQVWVDMNYDGDYDDAGEKQSMDLAGDGDGDYSTGEHFTKAMTLEYGTGGDGNIPYRFFASDGGYTATGLPADGATVEVTAPSVTITSVVPGSSIGEESGGSVTINFQLSEPGLCDATVPFVAGAGSTAVNADDYDFSTNPVVITAGNTDGSITVTPADDSLDEDDETVVVQMGTLTNASPGVDTEDTITIVDNDSTPTVTLSGSTAAGEGSAIALVTAELSAISGRDVEVPFSINAGSTALDPEDYTITSSPLVIPAGSISADITVTIVPDTLDENDETVIIDIGTPVNADPVESPSQRTVTISDDDDPPTVTFTSGSQLKAESDGTATITAQLSAASGLDVTLPFTLGGSATEGAAADYTITPSPIIITAGSTEDDITVTINDDGDAEPNETVIVTMDTPTNADFGATTVHTVTITDNDLATPDRYVNCTGDTPNYADISTAISNADPGDVIEVCAGTYSENINYGSKNLTIQSRDGASLTTIQGASTSTNAPVVTFANSALTTGSVLDGFTIDNQATANSATRGISITSGATPVLKNLIVKGNHVTTSWVTGAGIYINGGTATILDTTIGDATDQNTCQNGCGLYATNLSGELTVSGSDPDTYKSRIISNSGVQGSGIYLYANGSTQTTIINTEFGGNSSSQHGGGLHANNSKLSITGSDFNNNSVTASGMHGGAIYIYNSGASVDTVIEDTDFDTNSTTSRGGAIYITSATNNTPVSITGGLFSSNSAGDTGGAVYFVGDTTDVTVTGAEFTSNTAANQGGAIFAQSCPLTMTDNTIIGNTSGTPGGGIALNNAVTTFNGGSITGNNGQYGGAIALDNGSTLTVNGTIMNENSASAGGALYAAGSSTLNLNKAFVQGNSAVQHGGGVFVGTGTTTITNCIISGNTAGSSNWELGGGIRNTGTLNMYSSTVAGNYAPIGGGLSNAGVATVHNSIFWDNVGGTSSPEIAGTVTVTYSDVEVDPVYSGTGNINQDPVFVTTAQAGSGVQTTAGDFHIQSGSNVIDQGTLTDAPADDIDSETRDVNPDMGADEYVP